MPARITLLQPGDSFVGASRLVTQETINQYGALNGDNDIVHCAADFAREYSFHAPIADGMIVLGYLSEALREVCGLAWLTAGSLDIRWIGPVYPRDRITPGGRLTERAADAGGSRLELQVWCDNQDGRRVLTGRAHVLLPDHE